MANVLSEEKKQQVVGLGRLGWPLRRIEEATGDPARDGEPLLEGGRDLDPISGRLGPTAGAKSGQRSAHRLWGGAGAKPAKEVHTDSASGEMAGGASPAPWPPEPTRSPRLSRSEPYREIIERGLALRPQRHGDLAGPGRVTRASRPATRACSVTCASSRGEKTPEARGDHRHRARRGSSGRLRRGADGA